MKMCNRALQKRLEPIEKLKRLLNTKFTASDLKIEISFEDFRKNGK